MCGTSKPVRNPTPGGKPPRYQKSPSPDGVKEPPLPGYPIEKTPFSHTHAQPSIPEARVFVADELSTDSRRDSSISNDSESAAAVKSCAIVVAQSNKSNGFDESAADVGSGDDGSGVGGQLGTLHCTSRYDFDKSALIVTVNRCKNLPAKDASAKSRYVS